MSDTDVGAVDRAVATDWAHARRVLLSSPFRLGFLPPAFFSEPEPARLRPSGEYPPCGTYQRSLDVFGVEPADASGTCKRRESDGNYCRSQRLNLQGNVASR